MITTITVISKNDNSLDKLKALVEKNGYEVLEERTVFRVIKE